MAFSDEVELGTVITRDQGEKLGIHFESHTVIPRSQSVYQHFDRLHSEAKGNVGTALG